ncbi:hypothetical protein PsorP6_006841 [Peronosclerospora sorghi]|uniref:Uncharacterized protein n=1 Tax=Peronosclerospora sorghi TaxID=230839 RepID=A0ACC0W7P9_9STRA|nr:hypothetical protein PsorP6_006841 [Peronosclerospora sorghi]
MLYFRACNTSLCTPVNNTKRQSLCQTTTYAREGTSGPWASHVIITKGGIGRRQQIKIIHFITSGGWTNQLRNLSSNKEERNERRVNEVLSSIQERHADMSARQTLSPGGNFGAFGFR